MTQLDFWEDGEYVGAAVCIHEGAGDQKALCSMSVWRRVALSAQSQTACL